MSIRQHTIAKQLGLSISTVSLALRDAPQVAQETRQQVHAAAEQLGYKLRPRRVQIVDGPPTAITQLTFVMQYALDDLFYTKVVAGAEAECRRHGIALHYSRCEELNLRTIKQYTDTDALLVASSLPLATVQKLQQIGRPMVLVDNNLPHLGLDRVLIENVGGVYRAVVWLAERGHTHLAFLRGPNVPSFEERLLGFRRAVAEYGLEATEIECEDTNFATAEHTMTAWLAAHGSPAFTAMIGCSDQLAIGAMHTLQDHGIAVPDQVSVVGFDDIDTARMGRPTLTTCHVPRELLGEIAVRRLIERAANPAATPQAIVVDTLFVERTSTRPRP